MREGPFCQICTHLYLTDHYSSITSLMESQPDFSCAKGHLRAVF